MLKLYIWNENCIRSGQVDVTYEPEDLYEIQTLGDGNNWESDTVGINEPRPYEVCVEDIESFKRGDCGPDFAEAFSEDPEPESDDYDAPSLRCKWRIEPTGDTRCNGDHAEFEADDEASMIDEAREYLQSHPDNSWRARSYRNILAYLNASEGPANEEL
jgi:hypothetical protein